MPGEIASFVFFLSQGDWEVNTRQRMILSLATRAKDLWPESKILCVERPVCLTVTPFLARQRFLDWARGLKPLRKLTDNLFVFTPWVPVHDLMVLETSVLPRCNNVIQGYQVRQALKRIGAEGHKLITWVCHPYQRHYCQMLQNDLLIYDVHDEYDEFAGVRDDKHRVQQIRRNERLILKQADTVFATAANIRRRLATQHKNTFFVPNGADIDHFASRPADSPVPPEVDRLARPIIGFVGKINEQIDYPLVNQMARNHPDWSLVLLGSFDGQSSLKRDSDFLQAQAYPNIYFLGWIDYAQLPRYVQAFDVCLIPFVINTLTKSVYPLKLHEYLAARKPVVSTDLPEVRPFEEVVGIARDPDEFERLVVKALEERDANTPERRLAVARENSWEGRAGQVLSILEQAGFSGKRGPSKAP